MIKTIEEINELFNKYLAENMMYTNFMYYETLTHIQDKCDWIYNYINTIIFKDLIEMYWDDTIEINKNVVEKMVKYIFERSMPDVMYNMNCFKTLTLKYCNCYFNEILNDYISKRDLFVNDIDTDIFVDYIDYALLNRKFLK